MLVLLHRYGPGRGAGTLVSQVHGDLEDAVRVHRVDLLLIGARWQRHAAAEGPVAELRMLQRPARRGVRQ